MVNLFKINICMRLGSYYVFFIFLFFSCKSPKVDNPPAIDDQNLMEYSYTEDNVTLFPNPERGWVVTVNPNGNDTQPAPLLSSSLQAWKNGPDKITLVRKYYILKEFLNGPISATYLSMLQQDINTCRNEGFKIVPRFIYKWNVSAGTPEATLPIALQHIQQLKPYFNNNMDVIAFVEAGFVGKYGEWHGNSQSYIDNFSNKLLADGITLRDSLLSVIPSQRFLAMRYLFAHKMAFWPTPLSTIQAYKGSKQARIAYHHDYIMGESNWQAPRCGECPGFQSMLDYYIADTKWVPHTGEPCSTTSYYENIDPRPQLKALHQSTMVNNACIDYNFWKRQNWYEGLTKDMGYRISLTSAKASKSVIRGSNLVAKINLINRGYAAPYNPRKLELILRNQTTGVKFVIDITNKIEYVTDPRYWQPGEINLNLAVALPTSLAVGNYSLLLNLPDPTTTLHDLPAYSIRLANSNVWESVTGYNDLKATVEIK